MTDSTICPICENLCSSQAASCPKCGHPFPRPSKLTGFFPKFLRAIIDKSDLPAKQKRISIIIGLIGIFLLLTSNFLVAVNWAVPGTGESLLKAKEAPFLISFSYTALIIIILLIIAITLKLFSMNKKIQDKNWFLIFGIIIFSVLAVSYSVNVYDKLEAYKSVETKSYPSYERLQKIETGFNNSIKQIYEEYGVEPLINAWKVLFTGVFLLCLSGLMYVQTIQKLFGIEPVEKESGIESI